MSEPVLDKGDMFYMSAKLSNEEKAQLKYERRKNKRMEKRRVHNAEYDDFNKVFTYENLLRAAFLCKRNVNWKASVQNYMREVYYNVFIAYEDLQNRKFRVKSTFEFDTFERGKKRHIRSVHIRERVVQRCLCDNCLVPILGRTFIYDNGASMAGKGVHFALDRAITHLQRHFRKHGTSGYVLLFDFSDYFGSIRHDVIMDIVRQYITDEDLLWIIQIFVDMYGGDVGLGLGSQTSQVLSLLAASPIDHIIKDKYRVKGYVRYMDDGVVIHESKEFLENLLIEIQKKADELGLKLNMKKTRIVKIDDGFTFLKKKIRIDEKGNINIRIGRKSITRMRRKLKKFKGLLDEGKMTFDDIYAAYQAWRSFSMKCDAYDTVKNMDKLFDELFIIPFLERRDCDVFQSDSESDSYRCPSGSHLCEVPEAEWYYTPLQF